MNIRYLGALAAILFSALPSQAQTNVGWDTRFWPANEKPTRKIYGTNVFFQKEIVSSNLAFAIEERYWAVNKNDSSIEEDVNGYLPRNSVLALEEMKLVTRDLVNDFLDQTRFPTPDDPTSIVVNTPTSSVLQLIYWNQSNILVHCNLPTNFFEYTPVRNLAGHEGFSTATNDALYGWDALRKVLTNLVYTYTDQGFLSVTNISTNETIIVYDDSSRKCRSPLLGAGQSDYQEKTKDDFVESASTEQSFDWIGYQLENGTAYINENQASVDFSYLSAYLHPQEAPFTNNQHVAYAFTQQAGRSGLPFIFGFTPSSWPSGLFDDFQSCFTNFVEIGSSGFYDWGADRWSFRTTISTQGVLSDGSRIVIGQNLGVGLPSCSLCGMLNHVPTDRIDGASDGGFVEIDGVEYPYFGTWFDLYVPRDGLFQISSFVRASHVIKWDFTYK